MPDEIQDAVADSSTAVLEVPRDPAARAEWRQTGKLPAPAPKPAADNAAQGEAQSPQSDAPGSEPGTKGSQEKTKPPRDNAAGRLNEILTDLRDAGLSPAELKSFKSNYQRIQQQQAEASQAAPTEKTVNPAEGGLKPPVKPKQEDFPTWAAYEDARDKYVEDLVEYRLALRQQEQTQQAAEASVRAKMTEAKDRYGDAAVGIIGSTARAFTGDQQIPQAVKSILNDSPVWTDLLYTLGSGSELQDFLGLAKSNPGAAIRKLVVMEGLVQQELAKGGKQAAVGAGDSSGEGAPGRDASGKFTPGRKKESDAPPPATEVSGKGMPPPDPAEAAVKNGDARAYFRLKNEEARTRGRR